jgi:hypothetical protein
MRMSTLARWTRHRLQVVALGAARSVNELSVDASLSSAGLLSQARSSWLSSFRSSEDPTTR